MTTDRDLVERVPAGDTEAFGELVRKYQGAVYGLAYHRVRNFADAQDMAQEAFVKVFRKLAQLENRDRVGSWLKAIAANECRTWLRQRREVATAQPMEALAEPAVSPCPVWATRYGALDSPGARG